MSSDVLLSVVAPMKDEEAVAAEFVSRTVEALRNVGHFELIVVDDGSTDSTNNVLRHLTEVQPSLTVIRLTRNFGHQAAQFAGLRHAKGRFVAFLDGDLQDPPELLPEMLNKLIEKRALVVSGRRVRRLGETLAKKSLANLFYLFLERISDTPPPPRSVGDFRIVSRQIADALLEFGEDGMYIRGLIPWLGGRQELFDYERAPRTKGKTKFTLRKMMLFAEDGVVATSLAPLRFGLTASIMSMLVALGVGLWALAALWSGTTVPGWASTLLFISIFFGVTHAILAIMGTYLGKIHRNVLGRPAFFVGEVFSGRRE